MAWHRSTHTSKGIHYSYASRPDGTVVVRSQRTSEAEKPDQHFVVLRPDNTFHYGVGDSPKAATSQPSRLMLEADANTLRAATRADGNPELLHGVAHPAVLAGEPHVAGMKNRTTLADYQQDKQVHYSEDSDLLAEPKPQEHDYKPGMQPPRKH